MIPQLLAQRGEEGRIEPEGRLGEQIEREGAVGNPEILRPVREQEHRTGKQQEHRIGPHLPPVLVDRRHGAAAAAEEQRTALDAVGATAEKGEIGLADRELLLGSGHYRITRNHLKFFFRTKIAQFCGKENILFRKLPTLFAILRYRMRYNRVLLHLKKFFSTFIKRNYETNICESCPRGKLHGNRRVQTGPDGNGARSVPRNDHRHHRPHDPEQLLGQDQRTSGHCDLSAGFRHDHGGLLQRRTNRIEGPDPLYHRPGSL